MTRSFPAVSLAVLSFCLAAAASAAQLVPHRALYQVSLDGDAGNIQDATGAAAMDLERTCDGWIISQRMKADLTVSGDRVLQMETRFAGWESDDQLKYRFAVRNIFGDEHESFKGSADAGSADAPGSVRYTAPREGEVPLPQGVLFPVGHVSRLIDDASGGQQFVTATIFEGSDKVGTRLATTFIRPSSAKRPTVSDELADIESWTMRTAYFPAEGSGSVPDFEVQATQFANGVADDILLDYGDFSVLLSLQSFELLPQPDC